MSAKPMRSTKFSQHILISISAALFYVALIDPSFAANRDVCANCAYTSIVSAVFAAQSGDVIRIAAGIYQEDVDIQKSNWQIRLEGGYDSNFSARNSESIIEGWLRATPFNSGRVEFDGLTIRQASTAGITIDSESTDALISNCKIYNNRSYGIYVRASGVLQISNNLIYENGIYGGISIWRLQTSGPASILDNVIHSHSCRSCNGITLYQATSNDIINNNTVYGNETGISVSNENNLSSMDISFNKIYSNSADGISINKGAPNIHHNQSYNNQGHGGVLYTGVNAVLNNNTFVNNRGSGFSFARGNGHPFIRNNIFQHNDYGLVMGDVRSYGSTSLVIPSDFRHNSFFANSYGQFMHLGQGPEYVFNTDDPSAYGDINRFAWSDANIMQDAMFVDEANGDLRLSSSSFLIDEGSSDDSYINEPAPNGARVNLGAFGDTSSAETSAALPQLINLQARQSGNNIQISFDSTQSISRFWLDVDYWDGNAYQRIPASQLSAENYVIGYKGGRAASGMGQSLLWQNTHAVFGGTTFNSRIRARLTHGNNSSSFESEQFLIDYPLVAVNPTATPNATATPTFTAAATPTHALQPTLAPTKTATARPEATREIKATVIPTVTATSSAPINKPKNSETDKKKAKQKVKPKIRALNAKYRRASSVLELPLIVQDKDSSTLDFKVTLRRQSRRLALLNKTDQQVQARMTLVFDELDLAPGLYSYCVTARDPEGNQSEQDCGKFSVTSN